LIERRLIERGCTALTRSVRDSGIDRHGVPVPAARWFCQAAGPRTAARPLIIGSWLAEDEDPASVVGAARHLADDDDPLAG
jgi:hypothetical protein